jgi:hypothetical protein
MHEVVSAFALAKMQSDDRVTMARISAGPHSTFSLYTFSDIF